jgi:hypothetical protein
VLASFQQLECPVPQRPQLDKQRVDGPVGVIRHDPHQVCPELLQCVRADVGLFSELPKAG